MTTLVGIVGDSLHGGPLAGAVVMLDGSSREGVTDSIGRFRIDSVATGAYRVGIFHPILDSLGTSLATRAVTFPPGRPVLVSLATPSGRTLRHAICPDLVATRRLAERRDSGVAVLVGRVIDPDTDLPVAGAHVTLDWVETVFGPRPTQILPYERSTVTDGAGEFRFCGLPTGLNATLRASSASGDPVERELALDNRIITMATLHLAAPDSASVATSTTGRPKPTPTGELTGEVERPDGSPLPGATAIVLVHGSETTAVSDSTGAFAIRGVPTGTRMVVVRALGFEPVSEPVEITSRSAQHIVVPMTTPAYTLNPVIVEAQQLELGYARVGFSRRRQQGVGQFLTADAIAATHAEAFSQIFQSLPGIHPLYHPGGNDLASTRGVGSCLVYVLNGQPFNRIIPGELDALFQPGDIAGIEIYAPAEVPLEFRVRSLPGPNAVGTPTTGSKGCSTVVVWTKTELGAL
jgi:hypothetical protein